MVLLCPCVSAKVSQCILRSLRPGFAWNNRHAQRDVWVEMDNVRKLAYDRNDEMRILLFFSVASIPGKGSTAYSG